MTASKVTERAQLIAMVESHRDWEQSCGLTSGGKLLSSPTTLIVDVLDAVLRELRELERDVDERSREIGEVMQVNERLAKERDAARRELAEARKDNKDDPTPSGPRPWE